jgi:hypothetical protein
MKTYDEVQAVAKATWELDVEARWWADYTAADEVKCTLNCNDVFFWGCADSEAVEPADLPLLREAHGQLEALPPEDGQKHHGYTAYAEVLYCAKKRQMRPQGALYETLPKATWPLFNACGPHRPAEFGNPRATPA